MSRKLLAQEADVSERYLGQLELGSGNISVILLARVAAALNTTLADVLVEPARKNRIALIGLRGAGKSTLGAMLAKQLRMPFVELHREIERDAGLPVAEIFALYGQSGYRRIEQRSLQRALDTEQPSVISVGGGIVTDEDAFKLLLDRCYTVWLRASPEEHMTRVQAQGDLRPMAGNAEAMIELKRILASRTPLYSRADAIVDTSGETPQESLARLRQAVSGHLSNHKE